MVLKAMDRECIEWRTRVDNASIAKDPWLSQLDWTPVLTVARTKTYA